MQATIDRLILNSPFQEPTQHWRYHPEQHAFSRAEGRRPAGYVRATPGSRAFDDPGIFIELPLVNQIRGRVAAWRDVGYPGATGITQRLLGFWRDPEQRGDRRFFFCQLEAIETLIWLTEAPPAERQGIEIAGDGGPFPRFCAKMATGSGKTVVMAMLIAWQVLNKVTYPQDPRFAKNVLVVAPGLTVRNRLQVLIPSNAPNFYEDFQIVPLGMVEKLRQGRVLVRNWHALGWETDEQLAKKRSVDKRGAKSDEAYVREVLGELASAHQLLVINDEAHHAWRLAPDARVRGLAKDEVEEATKWIGGLDRIHRARGILGCYDFSATPFVPSGHQASEEALFSWIVSDFGLNDAIESGLVKTPRVVIRDDGRYDAHYRSRFYHLYMDSEVRADLNRPAEAHVPLPDLVANAYALLGKDWREAADRWRAAGQVIPPVMITVANRTETAARIKYAFDRGRIAVAGLGDPDRILHIDSKVLKQAEERDEPTEPAVGQESDGDDDGEAALAPKLTADQRAELLRRMVDTVGQPGRPGALVQNVISVGMLSEGWDARTVTHIMGLRAFTSQLLCEQVVGRGLRRTSYEVDPETGLFAPEYVNIFGVPFTFLPHESRDGPPPPPPSAKTRIEPLAAKRAFAIRWPNLVRIDHGYEPRLTLDLTRVAPLHLDASETPMLADLAPMVDGKPNLEQITRIDLEALGREQRWQRIAFQLAAQTYEQIQPHWPGNREALLGQVVRIVEQFVRSGTIEMTPALFAHDDLRRRILLTLNMNKLVQHVFSAIVAENSTTLTPVFDSERPIRATGDMMPWYTGKPCWSVERSHVNFCVFDSTWEATEAFHIENSPKVAAWVKNEHLGFEVLYLYNGVVHKYRPDFLVRLTTGPTLVLEVKGQDSQQNQAKRQALAEWVRAVNGHGGFGQWASDVSYQTADIEDILARHAAPASL
jgi:type III restriction enzyme